MLDVRIVLFDLRIPIKTSSTKGATDADNTACIGYDLIFCKSFQFTAKKTLHTCI